MLDHLDRYDGENYRMVDGGAILLGSGRGRGRREWVIKLVGAGAVRRPASGERRARRQGPGAGVKALPIGRFRPFEGFPGSSFPASASPIRRELFDKFRVWAAKFVSLPFRIAEELAESLPIGNDLPPVPESRFGHSRDWTMPRWGTGLGTRRPKDRVASLLRLIIPGSRAPSTGTLVGEYSWEQISRTLRFSGAGGYQGGVFNERRVFRVLGSRGNPTYGFPQP